MAHLAIATPKRPVTTSGNDSTTRRWAGLWTALGHSVTIVEVAPDGHFDQTPISSVDALISLHARRTAPATMWWAEHHRPKPLIVGLSGTDLYIDLPDDAPSMSAINAADRLVALQRLAIDRLSGWSPDLADKTRVIHQSVAEPAVVRSQWQSPADGPFRVVVLAHLRDVKDPLLAAAATRGLPSNSSIEVHHGGGALDDVWAERATVEAADNPRYHWLGPLDNEQAAELLGSATVLACTSVHEGGATVVSEALAAGLAVVGTRIDGNVGLLGDDYPGLVEVGDAASLGRWLSRLETEPGLLDELRRLSIKQQPITSPATEQAAWANLLAELNL